MLLPAAEAEGARLSAAGQKRWAARRRAPVLSYAGKDVSRPLRCSLSLRRQGRATCSPPTGRGPRSGAELCILAERAALPAAQRAASGWAAHPPDPQAVSSRCSSGSSTPPPTRGNRPPRAQAAHAVFPRAHPRAGARPGQAGALSVVAFLLALLYLFLRSLLSLVFALTAFVLPCSARGKTESRFGYSSP